VIRVEHIRKAGYCNKGARVFCTRHGIDWADFVQNGIAFERVQHINDTMLQKLIEVAREQ
jgi:hypothetical protein